ncbi:MAG: hypothetical protein IKG95_04950 [Bacteroidales bacterium]|nr:hypothetical protein [Bacteroidales bacterium]
MKNYGLATLLVTLMLASLFRCTNNRKSEKEIFQDTSPRQKHEETWDDFQRRKDSLWTVFNESTDEAEADKARVMLFDMGCNADWGMIVSTDYERRKARVEKEFQQLISAYPGQEALFRKEKERWENYHEAVLAVAELEDHGSSGALYITGVLEQSVDLWLASFHNLWLFDQNQDMSFSETIFTTRMIDDAYKAYFKQADGWARSYCFEEKDGLKEHHDALVHERKRWDEWMSYRKTVSQSLPKDLRKIYDGCTTLR